MTEHAEGFDRNVPSPARMYDYYLGGKDNFPADREAAEAVIARVPHVPVTARNNRTFLRRAVEVVAHEGVDQFVDVGTGVPTSPNVHEVVRSVHPRARIAYVDNDPVVLAHDRALLASDEDVAIVEGDMLYPEAILADPDLRARIDFDRPVGVIFCAVLHFSGDTPPEDLVAPFRDRMAPGSYLVVSHATSDGLSTEELDGLRAAYAKTPRGFQLRSRAEIEPVFDGFELLDPGLVEVSRWRGLERPTHIECLAGVGRRS